MLNASPATLWKNVLDVSRLEASKDARLVCVGGEGVPANRVVLAAQSPYFRRLLESQTTETLAGVGRVLWLHEPDLPADVVRLVVDRLHGKHISLTSNNREIFENILRKWEVYGKEQEVNGFPEPSRSPSQKSHRASFKARISRLGVQPTRASITNTSSSFSPNKHQLPQNRQDRAILNSKVRKFRVNEKSNGEKVRIIQKTRGSNKGATEKKRDDSSSKKSSRIPVRDSENKIQVAENTLPAKERRVKNVLQGQEILEVPQIEEELPFRPIPYTIDLSDETYEHLEEEDDVKPVQPTHETRRFPMHPGHIEVNVERIEANIWKGRRTIAPFAWAYICEYCGHVTKGVRANDLAELRIHVIGHERPPDVNGVRQVNPPVMCNICNRTFKREASLTGHMQQFHAENLFKKHSTPSRRNGMLL